MNHLERERLNDLLKAKVITVREHQILELRHGRNMSQYLVASYLGVSRSTIKSSEKNAWEKIARFEREAA